MRKVEPGEGSSVLSFEPHTSVVNPFASSQLFVKFFLEDGLSIDPEAIVVLFHRWIQEDLVKDEQPIDVTSYAHVHDGPGVLLITDRSHIGLDFSDGRLGLKYRRRGGLGGTGAERVRALLRAASAFVRLFEATAPANTNTGTTTTTTTKVVHASPVRFNKREIEFGIVDRLRAPNDPRTLALVEADLRQMSRGLFDAEVERIVPSADARAPFSVRLFFSSDVNLDDLRLAMAPAYVSAAVLVEAAKRRFDELHRLDPETFTEQDGATVRPWSVHYHERVLTWVLSFDGAPSLELRLAAMSQHLERFKYPRSEFPEGRGGYHRWRTHAAQMQAERAAQILAEVGFGNETIDKVKRLLTKADLGQDADAQILEDAACLVFIEQELSEFVEKHTDKKVADVIARTWKKMSSRAHEAAFSLASRLSPRARALLDLAIGTPEDDDED